jgi:hypothetical protein
MSSLGKVLNTSWDLEILPVNEMPEYVALESVVLGTQEWLETPFSTKIEALISNGATAYGHSTVAEYRQHRPNEIDNLIRSIKRTGVKATSRTPFSGSYYDNIQVNIARNGSFLFQGGFHRFCISKILGLKSVPAVIIVRHNEWMHRNNYNRVS